MPEICIYAFNTLVTADMAIYSKEQPFLRTKPGRLHGKMTMADFKYGVNSDVNIGVSATRDSNTLFEVTCIC